MGLNNRRVERKVVQVSDLVLRRMADFEWASACRYIVYLEDVAGLQPVNDTEINNFPVGRIGPKKVALRKKRALVTLEKNISSLSAFAGRHEAEFEPGELVVMRSMYGQIKVAIETVKGHIVAAEALARVTNVDFGAALEGDEDEQLF